MIITNCDSTRPTVTNALQKCPTDRFLFISFLVISSILKKMI